MMTRDDLKQKILESPARLDALENILSHPKRAIAAIDVLIKRPDLPSQTKKRYQTLRVAVEAYLKDRKY